MKFNNLTHQVLKPIHFLKDFYSRKPGRAEDFAFDPELFSIITRPEFNIKELDLHIGDIQKKITNTYKVLPSLSQIEKLKQLAKTIDKKFAHESQIYNVGNLMNQFFHLIEEDRGVNWDREKEKNSDLWKIYSENLYVKHNPVRFPGQYESRKNILEIATHTKDLVSRIENSKKVFSEYIFQECEKIKAQENIYYSGHLRKTFENFFELIECKIKFPDGKAQNLFEEYSGKAKSFLEKLEHDISDAPQQRVHIQVLREKLDLAKQFKEAVSDKAQVFSNASVFVRGIIGTLTCVIGFEQGHIVREIIGPVLALTPLTAATAPALKGFLSKYISDKDIEGNFVTRFAKTLVSPHKDPLGFVNCVGALTMTGLLGYGVLVTKDPNQIVASSISLVSFAGNVYEGLVNQYNLKKPVNTTDIPKPQLSDQKSVSLARSFTDKVINKTAAFIVKKENALTAAYVSGGFMINEGMKACADGHKSYGVKLIISGACVGLASFLTYKSYDAPHAELRKQIALRKENGQALER